MINRFMPFFRLDQNNVPLPCSAEEVTFGIAVGKSWVNGCFVSTVFLGINHNVSAGDPILFETMIFARRKGSYRRVDQVMTRYHTYADAQKGHRLICKALKEKRLTEIRCNMNMFYHMKPVKVRNEITRRTVANIQAYGDLG